MKYLDLEHRIIRYLGKLEGIITVAHLNVLLPQGNDYASLVDIQARRRNGESVSEVIPWTDAEFDMARVRALFVERFGDTEGAFDSAVVSLRSQGYLDADELKATVKCSDKYKEIENDRKDTLTGLGYDGVEPLFMWLESKSKPTKDAFSELQTKDYTI